MMGAPEMSQSKETQKPPSSGGSSNLLISSQDEKRKTKNNLSAISVTENAFAKVADFAKMEIRLLKPFKSLKLK